MHYNCEWIYVVWILVPPVSSRVGNFTRRQIMLSGFPQQFRHGSNSRAHMAHPANLTFSIRSSPLELRIQFSPIPQQFVMWSFIYAKPKKITFSSDSTCRNFKNSPPWIIERSPINKAWPVWFFQQLAGSLHGTQFCSVPSHLWPLPVANSLASLQTGVDFFIEPFYEPKMVPTCVINPSKSLGVGFWCFMIILKNIKGVRFGWSYG